MALIKKLWLFTLEEEYVYETKLLKGIEFTSDWLTIKQTKRGTKIIVPQYYSWDGCSPKIKIGKFIVGTPDGKINPETEKPITYYCSLVHDALYQFMRQIAEEQGVKLRVIRKEADKIFLINLIEDGFGFHGLYYRGVRWFGGVGR